MITEKNILTLIAKESAYRQLEKELLLLLDNPSTKSDQIHTLLDNYDLEEKAKTLNQEHLSKVGRGDFFGLPYMVVEYTPHNNNKELEFWGHHFDSLYQAQIDTIKKIKYHKVNPENLYVIKGGVEIVDVIVNPIIKDQIKWLTTKNQDTSEHQEGYIVKDLIKDLIITDKALPTLQDVANKIIRVFRDFYVFKPQDLRVMTAKTQTPIEFVLKLSKSEPHMEIRFVSTTYTQQQVV